MTNRVPLRLGTSRNPPPRTSRHGDPDGASGGRLLSLTAPVLRSAGRMLAVGAAASFAFSGSDLVAKFNSWKAQHSKVQHTAKISLDPAPASVR